MSTRRNLPPMKLNAAEMGKLDRIPPFQRCVYIFGLRMRMDYSTGYVGIKYPISYGRIIDS